MSDLFRYPWGAGEADIPADTTASRLPLNILRPPSLFGIV